MNDYNSPALIIQAHPRDDSLSKALLDEVVSRLEQQRAPHSILRVGRGEHLTEASLADCTSLVVVAPTWWGAMPAVLLHELQVLLGPWVDGNSSSSSSPVRTIERLVVVTTHGSPKSVNVLQGEPGKVLWERTILPLCAPNAAFDWVSLYGVDRIDADSIHTFIKEAGKSAVP